jgi:hypothetical protein
MRARHAQLLRLLIHHLGKGGFAAAAESFGQHGCRVIGGFGDDGEDEVANRDRFAGLKAEPRRRVGRGCHRHRQVLIVFQPPLIDRLKGQVQRHHLGERCRVGHRVRVQLAQDLPRLRVEDDGFVDRTLRSRRHARRAGRRRCRSDGERKNSPEKRKPPQLAAMTTQQQRPSRHVNPRPLSERHKLPRLHQAARTVKKR